jgi:hypothetical protein
MYDEQKSREHELAPELVALERQLRGMSPAAPRIDRDRLMFAAGQAAGAESVAESGQHRRAMYDDAGRPLYLGSASWASRQFWPAATFTMTAATLLLATMLVWQNRPQPFAQQLVPMQPAVEVNSGSHDFVVDRPSQLALRNRWASIPSEKSGYLGIRYVALTQGVGALSSDFQSPKSGDELPSSDHAEPTTRRGLLNEFLPETHPSNSSPHNVF